MRDYLHPDDKLSSLELGAQIDAAADRRVKLAAAIDFLGMRWRGRAICGHEYTRADGRTITHPWPRGEGDET